MPLKEVEGPRPRVATLWNEGKEFDDLFHVRIRDSTHTDFEVEQLVFAKNPVDTEVLSRDVSIGISFDASSFEL